MDTVGGRSRERRSKRTIGSKAIGIGVAVATCTAAQVAGAVSGAMPLTLESGGLAPPDPLQRDPYAAEQSATEQELARADREDSGRGLEFVWLSGEVGYEYVGLQTFKAKELVDAALVETNQSGLVVGGAAGIRLFILTLGGRFRLGTFSAWDLWTLDLEAGLRLPFGSVEPYFTLGGGYAALGSFDSGDLNRRLGADDLDISGWNVRAGFGVDYYVSPVFSVGGLASGDVLFLTRSRLNGVPNDVSDAYEADGTSIGGAGTLTAVLGLHF